MTLNLIIEGEIEFTDLHQLMKNFKSCPFCTPDADVAGASGCSPKRNLLLNVANLVHDPQEADTRPLGDIKYPL